MKASISFIMFLLPWIALGAEHRKPEEKFILPGNPYEACLKAKALIASKAGLSDQVILAGSPKERYLENLVRICAGLRIYDNADTLRTSRPPKLVQLPHENGVFRLDARLIAKLKHALAGQPFGKRKRYRFERKYGPIAEIPSLIYCHADTVCYLETLGGGSRNTSNDRKFLVTSAFRSTTYQKWLAGRNPNALPSGTATGTTHGTLSTVDIGYKSMPAEERKRREKKFAADDRAGRIQATKEWHQATYHIMVFPDSFFSNLAAAEKSAAGNGEQAAG